MNDSLFTHTLRNKTLCITHKDNEHKIMFYKIKDEFILNEVIVKLNNGFYIKKINLGVIIHKKDLLHNYITCIFKRFKIINSVSINLGDNSEIIINVDGFSYIIKDNIIYYIEDNKTIINHSLTIIHIKYMVNNFVSPAFDTFMSNSSFNLDVFNLNT